MKSKIIIISLIILIAVFLVMGFLYLKKPKKPNLLPDIKNNQPLSQSDIRNSELDKVAAKLPYADPSKKYVIEYYQKTKDIVVKIQNVNDTNSYRQAKLSAEAKLKEFGVRNICLLLVSWVGPENLRQNLTREDLISTGCN